MSKDAWLYALRSDPSPRFEQQLRVRLPMQEPRDDTGHEWPRHALAAAAAWASDPSSVGRGHLILRPLRDGVDDAADQLLDAALTLRRPHLAAEVLRHDDVGGLLRPRLGDLDVALLEDHLAALVRDHRGAELPFDLVVGVNPLGGEVPTKLQLFSLGPVRAGRTAGSCPSPKPAMTAAGGHRATASRTRGEARPAPRSADPRAAPGVRGTDGPGRRLAGALRDRTLAHRRTSLREHGSAGRSRGRFGGRRRGPPRRGIAAPPVGPIEPAR